MTADTSAVVAALSGWHDQHETAAKALASVDVLPAHATIEAYAVLTRLPAGLATPPAVAASVLAERFPRTALRVPDDVDVVGVLARAGVRAGAAYDGLVALEAVANDRTLISLDARARGTYANVGARVEVLGV